MDGGVIGLDVGTGSTRGVLVDLGGRVLAVAERFYPTSFPHPLWAEQDPAHWGAAALEVLAALAARAADGGVEVRSLGLTGQMHGAVLLDASDQPVRPAIIWMDQRSRAEAQELDRLLTLRRLEGEVMNPGLPNMTATKLLWLQRSEPRAYRRVRRLLLPKDYVRLLLTGEAATDVTDASGTLLLDVVNRRWSMDAAKAVGLSPAVLPRLFESSQIAGTLVAGMAERLGLRPGLPVAAGAGDQAAGALAAGVVEPGPVMVSLGTSGVVFGALDRPLPKHPSLHSFCHAQPGSWHWMGVTQSAGGSLKWLRDELFPNVDYASLDREAEGVCPGADGLQFLPYLMGERAPLMDPLARGAFVGLTLRHGRAHLVRSVLEGVAFSLRSVLDVSPAGAGSPIRATGGGARSRLWLRILASVLALPVTQVTSPQGPAFGAAMLAAQAIEEPSQDWPAWQEVVDGESALRGAEAYRALWDTHRALYPALRPTFHALSTAEDGGTVSAACQGRPGRRPNGSAP